MQTKHTPGPWDVARCMERNNKLICHGDENERSPIVATVMHDDGRLPRDANARLIAAAPELLEALEALQANPNDPRAHRQALDAIQKARG